MSENFEQLTGYKATDILESRRITITDIAHPNDRIYLLTTFWKQLEAMESISGFTTTARSLWMKPRGSASSTGSFST
jgi:hypothetical protein